MVKPLSEGILPYISLCGQITGEHPHAEKKQGRESNMTRNRKIREIKGTCSPRFQGRYVPGGNGRYSSVFSFNLSPIQQI